MRRRRWRPAVLAAIVCAACEAPHVEAPSVSPPVRCAHATHATSIEEIPATFDRAIRTLAACMSASEQHAVLAQPERDFVLERHMGHGLAVRNWWIRPEGSPLLAELRALGFEDPDDMSAAMFSALWHHIHERPIDVRARAACDRAWSAERRRRLRERSAGAPLPPRGFECIDEASVQAARPYWEADVR